MEQYIDQLRLFLRLPHLLEGNLGLCPRQLGIGARPLFGLRGLLRHLAVLLELRAELGELNGIVFVGRRAARRPASQPSARAGFPRCCVRVSECVRACARVSE